MGNNRNWLEVYDGPSEEESTASLQIQAFAVPRVGDEITVTSSRDGDGNYLNDRPTTNYYKTIVKGVVVRVVHEMGEDGYSAQNHHYYHFARVFTSKAPNQGKQP